MLTGQLAQKSHLFWRILHNFKPQLISHGSSHANLISKPIFSTFQNVITRTALSYSLMACESETYVDVCNGKTYMPSNPVRPYQVVVAATRDMGIGMDGKLPWNLPSDLRYFKELTTTTSVDGRRNAVIMGRKTWESIPPKYQPLPGRLNVVLTRAGKLEAASTEDIVVCNDLFSALKLLMEPPHSALIEKVFVIGGGQILKEALNGPGCEAIHLTDIEANIECDTFIPPIDLSLFTPLFSSSHMVENNIWFSFVTYVRMSNSAEVSSSLRTDARDMKRETAEVKLSNFSKRHVDLDYLKQIQENIASGKSNR